MNTDIQTNHDYILLEWLRSSNTSSFFMNMHMHGVYLHEDDFKAFFRRKKDIPNIEADNDNDYEDQRIQLYQAFFGKPFMQPNDQQCENLKNSNATPLDYVYVRMLDYECLLDAIKRHKLFDNMIYDADKAKDVNFADLEAAYSFFYMSSAQLVHEIMSYIQYYIYNIDFLSGAYCDDGSCPQNIACLRVTQVINDLHEAIFEKCLKLHQSQS